MNRLKRSMPFILRVVTAIALLGLLLVGMESRALIETLSGVDAGYLVLAFLAILVTRLLSSVRWHLLLRQHGFKLRFARTLWVTLVSSSMSVILPGGVGGDVVRGYMVGAGTGHVSGVVSTIVVDRIIGLYSMLFLALLGAVVFWRQGQANSEDLLLLTALMNLGFFGAMLSLPLIGTLAGATERVAPPWLRKAGTLVTGQLLALREVSRERGLVFVLFLSSLLVQLARCISYYFVFQALGADVELLFCVLAIPLVFIIQLVPASVGGFGVREVGLVYFFGLYGIPAEASFSAGIIYHALMMVMSALVVPVWLLQKRRAAEPAALNSHHTVG